MESVEEIALQETMTLHTGEPILDENPGRFVLFPIVHHDIWHFYKKSEAN
jgi:ribonucleoside-diphosphate reductase subunit M2